MRGLSAALAAHAISLAATARMFRHNRIRGSGDSSGSCVRLKNQGAYSTVEVAVGTPPQKFDVVADTGSDNLIVTSCACVDSGHCRSDDKCFRGTNRSSTFKIAEDPKAVTITFGSGPVQTAIATDVVSVGSATATMEESLLLMINHKLEHMDLEGILGLGVHASARDWGRKMRAVMPDGSQPFSAPGFLEAAHVSYFSVCFNSDADGVLRLGGRGGARRPRHSSSDASRAAAAVAPLGVVGQSHWSVGLDGITVGDQARSAGAEFAVCNPKDAKPDQKTPCGAIVDSGTTLITAPGAHLTKLYEELCDSVSSCKDSVIMKTEGNATKALQYEVASCNFSSLPTLHFHVSGAGGNQQTLDLEPTDYILETEVKAKGKVSSMCLLAFGTMDYETEKNGGVWIFGTPFYYKYNIGYDLSTSPPEVTFGAHDCTPCGEAAPPAESLMATGTTTLRRLSRPPRYPSFDTSSPL